MDKYVVDRETAEKLKGYLPEGFRSKFVYIKDELYIITKDGLPLSLKTGHWIASAVDMINAPILDEMLELLPKSINLPVANTMYFLKIHFANNGGAIRYLRHHIDGYKELQRFAFSDTKHWDDITIAAAKLYMWLVDEGYIKQGDDDEKTD